MYRVHLEECRERRCERREMSAILGIQLMQAVVGACPALAKAPLRRTEAALALRRDATPFDADAALQEYRALTQERLDA